MGMQLNIKSDEAYELASQLAELTGQTITSAVTGALRQQLDAERRRRDKEAWIADIRSIAAEIRLELTKSGQPLDLSTDFLYDEATGLPV